MFTAKFIQRNPQYSPNSQLVNKVCVANCVTITEVKGGHYPKMTMMGLEYLKYREDVRANMAREGENVRSNQAREGETVRHNVVTETLGQLIHGETVRSNVAKEAISYGNLDELVRSNTMRELQNAQSIAENVRQNKARESISWATLGETTRANRAKETISLKNLAETVSHNAFMEGLGDRQLSQLIDYQSESIRHSFAETDQKYYNGSLSTLAKLAPLQAGYEAADTIGSIKGTSNKENKIRQYGTLSEGAFTQLSSLIKFPIK